MSNTKFRKGIDAVKESSERAQFSSSGTRRYFKWNPGEEKVLRFLTDGDDVVLATMHEFVQCHDGSKRSFVCRQDLDEECELCANPDARKREIAYGVAVWREARRGDGQTTFGTKTETIEVEKDGKKTPTEVPWVGIVQQAPRNFWSWFWSAYQAKGTLLDRDYTIRRSGSGMDTDYQPFPEDPQPFDASKVLEYAPDIEEMLEYLGSKEYYDKWLHGVQTTKDAAPVESQADLAEDDMALLREANAGVTETAISGAFD